MTSASVIVILLVIAATLVLNSGMVDHFARKQLVDLFNSEYRGHLLLGEVRIRFPDQVTISTPRIFEEGHDEPAVSAETISMKFNVLSLIRPKITLLSFREVNVDGFRANIVEYPDRQLNVSNIFTRKHPEKPEVLAIGKFRARHFRLRNGFVSWKPANKETYTFRNLELDMSQLFVARNEFMGTIRQMQFSMPERGLKLKKGAGTIAFSSVRSDLIGMDIETEKSHAKFSVSMDGLNLFSGFSKNRILKSDTFVHIESVGIDSGDLSTIVSLPMLPKGVYRLQGDARGTLSNMEIMPSTLEVGDSHLFFHGQLLNLLDRDNLSFRLQIDKSAIASRLFSEIVREARYQTIIRETGRIDFSGMLRGKPDHWMTNLDVKSSIGAIETTFETIKSGNERFQLSGTFDFDKIKPDGLIGNRALKSIFSGSGSFNTTIATGAIEQTHIEASVRNASWAQQSFTSGAVSIDFERSGFDFTVRLSNPEGSGIITEGSVDLTSPQLEYDAVGSVRKLDIARLSGLINLRSDLNGSFELKGTGTDATSLNLQATMTLEPSTINGFQFRERSIITADILQSAESTSIVLTNEAFDLSIRGRASLPQILLSLQNAGYCISKSFGNQKPLEHPGQNASRGMFSFRATVRDVAPLRPFLPINDYEFKGSAVGQMENNGGSLQIDTEIECARLSKGTAFTLNNTALKVAMLCAEEQVASATFTGTTDLITIAGKEIRDLRLLSSFSKEQLDTSLDLHMPQYDTRLSTAFHSRRNASQAAVTIDRLQFVSPKGIWQVSSGSTLDIATDFIYFNKIRLYKEKQAIEFDGLLSSTIPGTFLCSFTNINLADTAFILPETKLNSLNGLANGKLTVYGSPESKTAEFEMNSTGVVWNEFTVGTVTLSAHHAGQLLQFSYESRSGQQGESDNPAYAINAVKGSGSIPLIIDYSPFRLHIPDHQPIHASFNTDDLSARIITRIIPVFDYAEGTIPANLRIEGTMPQPAISLNITLDGTKIRIAPTWVTYQLTGRIVGNLSRLDVSNLEMKDNLGGTGTIRGMIGLDGLKAVSIDLAGSFRNLLLYSKKDLKDDTSFGTISASTDNLRFYGDLAAPVAEGELKLTSTNFSLYRKGSSESAKYVGVDKFIRFVPRQSMVKPVETIRDKSAGYPQFHYNLLDILQIRNLRLSSTIPIKGTMIFDRIRGERIEATMNNLSFLVNKSEQRYSLYGSVDITGGKYAFSNSSFDLDNSGRINWNNEEIRNGHLNDIFGTKQVSANNIQTGERDNVRLLIAVSGTIDMPNVRMGYYLNDDPQPYSAVNTIGRQSSHIDPNADLNVISMLFSRQWYLNPERQNTTGANPVQRVGVSAGTGLLSSQVSGIVQDIAGIESFNVNLGTGADGNLSDLELYFAMLVPGTDGKIRFIGTGNTPVSKNASTSNSYYGSSQKIEYRVNPRVYIEAFRSYGLTEGDITYSNLQKPTENWGASVSYREKFQTWSQLWEHVFGGKKKEKTQNTKE